MPITVTLPYPDPENFVLGQIVLPSGNDLDQVAYLWLENEVEITSTDRAQLFIALQALNSQGFTIPNMQRIKRRQRMQSELSSEKEAIPSLFELTLALADALISTIDEITALQPALNINDTKLRNIYQVIQTIRQEEPDQ